MHGNDYITMEDLTREISGQLASETPSTALSGPLRELKTPAFGDVLKDVERTGGAGRIQNVTSFTDPMMKSFVRFMVTLDKTRLVPEEEGVNWQDEHLNYPKSRVDWHSAVQPSLSVDPEPAV